MKTVLITGASSGFGAMMALKFAREGFYVYATARDLSKEGVKEISDISQKEGLEVEWIKLDVTVEEDVERAVKRIVENGMGIDVLVNNAGYGLIGPVETFTLEQVKAQFDTNYFGVLRMVYAFLPLMREKGAGTIVNISSIAGLISVPMYGIYSSSKYALEAMSEALRNEVRQFGVKVCLVEPGSFDTKFGSNVKGGDLEKSNPYYHFTSSLKSRRKAVDNQVLFRLGRKFSDPMQVVDRVFKLTVMENPPLRSLVGLDAKLEYLARRVLPLSVWDMVVRFGVSRLTRKK